MKKIGVLGAGHLGKIHIKCINQIEELSLVGFFDPDNNNAAAVSKDLGVKSFDSVEALIEASDIVDIVTPTPTHFDLAVQSMKAGRHVFIEKPVTEMVEQARELVKMQNSLGVRVQIGHVERFNPAYLALKDKKLAPMFIEGHRLSTYNPRGNDVSVVLDLMIHDLDLVLQLVPFGIKEIRANGVKVVGNSHDICNARIEFDNGCIANLTASRISLKQMRKLRLFQRDAYVTIDMLEKQAQIISLSDDKPEDDMTMELPTPNGNKWISIKIPESRPNNAIVSELKEFHDSIVTDGPITVSLEQGYSALSLAHEIIKVCDE